MADIYAKLTPQYYGEDASASVTRYTGDEDTDKYLNSLPVEKRADALKRLTAPLTGEELAERAKDPNYNMDRNQYSRFLEWKKTEDKGVLDDIGMLGDGVAHIFEQIAKAAGSVKDHPLESLAKLGPSGVEAFAQGTRGMYGMLAQSTDPTSKFFRLKSAIFGEDSDEGYSQYQEAREFNRNSIEYAEGKRHLLANKEYIDHEMTQAMSYIADPTLFIPFGNIAGVGLKAIGMGEKAALLAARASHIKNMMIGGTLKYVVGKPIELIGGATRNIIDYGINTGAMATEAVTGLSAREIASTVRMGSLGTTAASLAGHTAPIVTAVSQAHIAGGFAHGIGQALSGIGGQMQRGPRGFLSYAKAALEADKAILSPQAKNLLKIINAADPMLSLSADVVKGSTQGALIGGGLGYGNNGYEGLWQGAGAGMALGGVGGLAGSILARATGAKTIERADIMAKYAIEGAKELGKHHTAMSYEFLRKIGEITGTKPMMDGIVAALDGLAPEARYVFRDDANHLKFLDDNGFDRKTGKHIKDPTKPDQLSEFEHINMDGVVMESAKDGTVTMHINTTKLSKGAKGGFKAGTVPHELLHLILRKAVMTPHFIENLKHDLLGVRDSAGKLLEGGAINPSETREFFREYVKRMYNKVDKRIDPTGHAVEAKRLTDIVDKAIEEYEKTGSVTLTEALINSKKPILEHLTEEFGAYYFQELVGAKPPDFLFFAGKYDGLRGVLDRTANRFTDYFERKRSALDPRFQFKEGKTLAESFRDKSGKRIRVGSIDYMISDLLSITQNQNRNGRIDISLMSDKARGELILRKGLDDLGRTRGARDPRRTSLSSDLQLGKAIHAELLAIDPARQTDGAGNIIGHLSDKDLAGLVRAGHISEAMARKVKTLQDLSNSPDKSVFESGYWGQTHTVETGPNVPRVTGDEVPFTNRLGLLLGVDIKIGKNGKVSMVARTLDLRVNAERRNNMWANPSVRDLWNGDAAMFEADYTKYLLNMGKDVAGGKIETSLLLDNGDGKGGQRRDVMHQIAGVPLGSGDAYANHPIGEIYHDALNAYTMLSIGRMQDIRLTGDKLLGFEPKNAIPDIGRNFSPSDMAYRETPNGKQWEHKTGYKFHQVTGGKVVAYDRRGETIGSYDTPEQAMLAGKQKLQKQQQAFNEVVQDTKAAYERGVHFSPREEFIRTQRDEKFTVTGARKTLRENIAKTIDITLEEIKRGENDPNIDPRHLRSLADKVQTSRQILQHIDDGKPLFERDVQELILRDVLPLLHRTIPTDQAGIMKRVGTDYFVTMNDMAGARSWDKMYPMTFRSALNDRIQEIIKKVPNITAQKLRKQLLQYGSRTGERLWAEAEAIGLIDWLEAKIEPTYILARRKDAQGNLLPRGEEHSPVLKQKGVRDAAIDPKELEEFIKENKISVTIDYGATGDVANTERYTFGGTKGDYNETAIRIDQDKYRHPVEGHYNRALLHTRRTIRFDSEGNKYIYVEEVQRQNAEGQKPANLLSVIGVQDLKRNVLANKEKVKQYELLEKNLKDKHGLTEQTLKDLFYFLEKTNDTRHGWNTDYSAVMEGLASKSKASPALRELAKDINSLLINNPDILEPVLNLALSRTDSGEFFRATNDIDLKSGALSPRWSNERKFPLANAEFFKQLIKENPDIFIKVAEFRDAMTKGTPENPFGDPLRAAQEFNLTYKGAPLSREMFVLAMPYSRSFDSKGFWNSGMPADTLPSVLSRVYHTLGNVVKEHLKSEIDKPSTDKIDSSFPEYVVHRKDKATLGSSYSDYLGLVNALEIQGHTSMGETSLYRHSEKDWKLAKLVEDYKDNPESALNKYRKIYKEYLEAKRKVFAEQESLKFENSAERKQMKEYYGKAFADALVEGQGTVSYMTEDAASLRTKISDDEALLQRNEASKNKKTGYPLESLKDTSLLALKHHIADAIRKGVDTIVLTHPDDAPTVSMMEFEARHGTYGEKGIPAIWGGFLQKYGITVQSYNSTERFLGGIDVAKNPEVKKLFADLSTASSETFKACKVMLDLYESGNSGLDARNVEYISSTSARPIHEVATNAYGQEDWKQQSTKTLKSLRDKSAIPVEKGGVLPEVYHAYAAIVKAKQAESQLFESVVDRVGEEQVRAGGKQSMSRDELITAMALSRGKHFVLNDAVKKDIMSGKAMTNYSVAEGGKDSRAGGRTYDFASDLFRKTFIGKYYNDNKDTLPQGMTIELGKTHHQIGDPKFGFSLSINQSLMNGTYDKQIAHIVVNVEGEKAYVSSTGVAKDMTGKKLNNVLMSELAERVRSMGVKYLDGVIIDPLNRPYHARMRTIGNADTIAGGYYDTTRSTLDKNAWYSPSEKQGGRTYTDKQFSEEFVGRFAAENPDIASKYIIRTTNTGEGEAGDGYKIVIYDKVTRKPVARTKWEVMENENGVLEDAATDMKILDESYKGKQLSHLLNSEQLERSRSLGAEKVRSQIINEDGIPIKNYARTIGEQNGELTSALSNRYDANDELQYLPATMENFRSEMEVSKAGADGIYRPTVYYRGKLDKNAWYSPSEGDKGGRTYDQKSLKWKKGFIGRYAAENPEMTKELKLTFETEKAGVSRGMTVMAGRVAGKSTHNHYLQITEAGKEIGHITWKTQIGAKDGRKIFSDPSVKVDPAYRGKNYQHLLYSEAAERARAMGNTDFFQRIENDLGLPLKSQVKTFGENYSKLLDQYTGQYLPATMDNFNKLKYPEMELHITESDGTVNIQKHKGHELWVYAWSKIQSDKWYAISEQDALVLRKTEDMDFFKKAMDKASGFVRYATAKDLNDIRGLHAISHGPDTLSGTDIYTVGGERILEGAGGLPYPMLQAERGSPAAWASQGTGFADIVNSAVKANKDNPKINRREAIMPLVFTTYEKARAAVQGSEAYYNLFNILKRGNIVPEQQLRLAMLDAVEKVTSETDKKTGNTVIENKQTNALRKIVADNKMNWDAMLAQVMLTLDDKNIQNFGTRPYMLDDFMGAMWERVMKGLSDKKKQEVMRFFPEWDASQTQGEFTLANFKSTMGKTIADSLTKGLKSGDVYAIFKFTDFVEPMKSGHRTYDTGIVQKNGQKPELLLLKKPINVMDLHETSLSASSGQRKLSDLPPNVQTNLLGMNTNPYGRTITKGVGQVDFRDIMANMSVKEKFTEKVAPSGKVLQAINGYIIMQQGDKFKVYNSQKVQVGIYAEEAEAKKRALRDRR